jgi:hypothetical protein
MAQPRPKAPRKEVLRFALLVVAIFGVLVGVKVGFSLGAGKPCEGSLWGCRFGLQCAGGPGGRVCRHKCDSDGDCPPGEHCALIISVAEGDRVAQICY